MPPFEHLAFLQVVQGTYKFTGSFGRTPSDRTKLNQANPAGHSRALRRQLSSIRADWQGYLQEQAAAGFPPEGPDAQLVPLFLQVDPSTFSEDTLRGWGIEVVAVEANGYIIGIATNSALPQLTAHLDRMLRGQNVGVVAAVWEIMPRAQSLTHIVDARLLDRWTTLETETDCYVEVGVAVDVVKPALLPITASQEEYDLYDAQYSDWYTKRTQCTSKLERLVSWYGGEVIGDGPLEQADTVNYKLRVSGKLVKEIAALPYVFCIEEWDWQAEARRLEEQPFHNFDVDVLPPAPNAPRVCVIDSGIQSGHRLLQPAIDADNARCYLPHVTSTADQVPNGGHGTRVAGAILYPEQVPVSGQVQAPVWLQNARILNARNSMEAGMFPAQLMRRIVSDFYRSGTRLFNLSVQTPGPCRLTHMSSWAAEIDQLSFDTGVLFITSAGNISAEGNHPSRLSVAQHLAAGRSYPDYLLEPSCRIGNPAQSAQALTVGSVSYEQVNTATHSSFGGFQQPSAFSRTGLGMWEMIKPDVVEYGGDLVRTAANTFVLNVPAALPELVTSTLNGHPAVARTDLGTSYAAPKVTHIAAALQQALPTYSTLLYRGLIAQSAQWPSALEDGTQEEKLGYLRTLGYGIPDKDRALRNSDSRVTFIAESRLGADSAHLYQVKLNNVTGLDDETFYRLDVTLSYAARPRRTRQQLRGYLSTLLRWQAADLGQSLDEFLGKVDVTLQTGYEDDTTDTGAGTNRILWQIGSRADSKKSAKTVRRPNSAMQKDWAFVKGYELSRDRLLFAVTGHRGWDKGAEEVPYAFTVSITSLSGVVIYETIRLANQIEIEV